MKNTFTLLLLLTTSLLLGQQQFHDYDYLPGNIPSYKPAYQADYPTWAQMLYAEDINFLAVEESYQAWKSSGLNDFRPIERYYKIWRQQVQPFLKDNGDIDLTDLDQYEANLYHYQTSYQEELVAGARSNNAWEFLGPKETFWLNESGETETPAACPWQVNIYSFDIANTDYSTIYCGTETGFVNKSTDNGLNWELLGQAYSFGGGVTAVTIHPFNKDIVYVAAGRQIHKTIDGGQEWEPLLASNERFYADNIAIDETNPNKVFAAGANGVYLSVDGGLSWSNIWNHHSYDVHLKPDDPSVVYTVSKIGGNFNIAFSTNGGETFQSSTTFPLNIEDAAGALLAVTAAAPEKLYAILLSSNNTPLVYRGDMETNNWDVLATGQTDLFPLNNGQGFFDLAFEVSPTNANIIFAGTSTLYKSTNEAASFSIIGGYGGSFPIHPDIQCMKLLDNGEAWVSTDGGFTHSTDNFTLTENAIAKNNNLIGSDMWGFDQGWNEDLIVGGRYHNGNTAIADFYQPKALRMGGAESPTGWVMQGKSKHVAFNDLGAGWILPETSTSAPQGRFIFSKYPNMDEYGGRRGNMFFHPNYYEMLYLGSGDGFWRSSDQGTSFELLHDFGDRIRFCQIAYADPNVIYADVNGQGLHRSDDGGYTWTLMSSLTNGQYGSGYWAGKLHFAISPNDANTIYACLQNGTWSADIGKVFKSTDGGETWEDWSGTLDTYTKVLVVQPDANGNDILYLFSSNRNGSPGQCYIRRPGETDWSVYSSAYPAGLSPNFALPFFRDSKIRVAGNGGIWEHTLDEPNFQPIVQPWIERPFFNCMLDTIRFEDHSILNHENASWEWQITPAPLYLEDANKRNPKVVLGNPGSYSVTLTITKDGITYAKTIEDMVSTIECPSLENCDNPALLPKDIWELMYVNSEEVNYPGYATMAFDDNPETIWHTRWSTGSDPYPHEMQIDLGALYYIHEFTYLPRQVGQNGWIKDYEIYFSEDAQNWGVADSIGQFESSAAPHKIAFNNPPVGRYLKLVALSEVNGNAWASAAEFDITGCYHETVTTEDLSTFTSLPAFPVPTQGLLNIPLPKSGIFNYSIFNMTGQLLAAGQLATENESLQFDLSKLTNGIYFIRLQDENNRSFIVKAIKGE